MSLFVQEDEEDGYYDDIQRLSEGVVRTNQQDEQELAALFEEPDLNEPIQDTHIPLIERDSDPEDSGIPQLLDVTLSLPLKFQQQIVQDLIDRDGLLILGRGLGLEPIAANLVHALSAPSTLENRQNKRSLVILLNALDNENEQIGEELTELSWIDSFNDVGGNGFSKRPFVVVGGETITADKRKKVYECGGIVSITSRVFVVDLLSEIIDSNLITGIVLLHAERVNETSNESFIINLYRSKNKWGFIKALSDDPESIKGFSPLATKLKNLKLQQTILYPRFHVDISSSLKAPISKAQKNIRSSVTEINVKMSDSMKHIQIAILACIEACISEMKRHNPTLASDYWSMENALDPQFVQTIRITLDPQWHRITWTSKQLVHDLSTLQELLHYLINYDSVSFYQVVQGIIATNRKQVGSMKSSYSPWLELEEANTIITYAKQRALSKVVTRNSTPILEERESGEIAEDGYTLEELPKWEQLAILLDDIAIERAHSDDTNAGPTLIMCSDSSVCRQLREYLQKVKEIPGPHGSKSFSGRQYMVSKLRSHLEWMAVSEIRTKLNQEPDNLSHEEKQSKEIQTSKTFMRGRVPASKRRRTRGGSVVANVNRLHSGTHSNIEVDLTDELLSQLEEPDEQDNDRDESEEAAGSGGGFLIDDDDVQIIEESRYSRREQLYEYIERKDQVIIEKYNDRTDDLILDELMPSYIIMYEPDLSFIRRIECYQAINRDTPARTYFLYYGSSVEEQKHLTRIRKEKDAFTRLIREKASLATHFETDEDNSKFMIRRQQVANTRIAGGSTFRTDDDEMKVIVDIREFRSSLPNLLYRIGMKVIPCMITVGDYIVSPKICIERKAIPDLISSFKSGRLYTQCEQMFRYYELPCLLIEFDEAKSFSLEPFSELRSRVGNIQSSNEIASKLLQQDIQTKLVMLLVAFPKLKIIWSSSPYQTAQIFLQLKSNQDEPDPIAAVAAGFNSHIDSDGPPQFNDHAIDLIQNIPGITGVNYHLLIKKIKNIRQLVNLSLEEFTDMIGEEAGSKAFSFINKSVKS